MFAKHPMPSFTLAFRSLNSVSINDDTRHIGSKIDDVDRKVHELPSNLEIKLLALTQLVSQSDDEQQKAAVNRLQVCARSAATVFLLLRPRQRRERLCKLWDMPPPL